MYEINDVNATKILLDVEQSAPGHSGHVSEQRVIDAAVCDHQDRMPTLLTEEGVEKPHPAFLHLAKGLAAEIGFIPTRVWGLKESLHLAEVDKMLRRPGEVEAFAPPSGAPWGEKA